MNQYLLQCLVPCPSCKDVLLGRSIWLSGGSRSTSYNGALLLVTSIWLLGGLLFAPSPLHFFLSGRYCKSSICNIPNTLVITYNYIVSEGIILGMGKLKGHYIVVLDLKAHSLVDHHVVPATHRWQFCNQPSLRATISHVSHTKANFVVQLIYMYAISLR
jgi:hypothetical protein